jgi:NitT/TauT family transport system permease protein/sulfonate transport system permease protein
MRIVPGPAELQPQAWVRRRRIEAIALGVATPVILVVLWQISADQGWIDTRFFPSPARIVDAAIASINRGQLQTDFVATAIPLTSGLVAGFLSGALVGFIMGLVRPLRLALDPVLSALYTVPKLALLPLLLLIFGLGVVPKVVLIALGVFFIIWITVLEAVVSVPETYLETARSFRVGRVRTFTKVIFPEVLPKIFVGLRIAVGNAVLIAVGIEFVNGSAGIGYRIWNSWQLFVADRMYVGIVVVALLGIALRLMVDLLRWIFVPWQRSATGGRDG